MPPDPDAPYEVVQCDAPPVDDGDWRQEGEDWFLEVRCPRCGHRADRRFGPDLLSRFRTESGSGAQGDAVMRCNCGSTHAGREGGSGCGAWWGFAVEKLT